MLRGVTVGCGFFSRIQMESWGRVTGTQIVAACDLDAARAAAFARDFGLKPYTDLDAMLDAERPDFVDVATRPSTHVALVEKAVARRLPVLCQKPMAETWEDARRVADALHSGDIDLGVIPSIEYAAGDYAIVPGVGIASRGPVRSVSLFHRRPLSEVRRVALDSSSRTSAALLRILLHDRLGRDPEYVVMNPSLPDMLATADAALLIGDRALYFEGEESRLDLGQEWTDRTALPFVWAFWAGRRDASGVG